MSGTVAIVGASRGLGLGLAGEYLDRGWRVSATTRGRGDEGLRTLAMHAGERLRLVTLDMTEDGAAAALAAALEGTPLDLLFVSAGVLGDAEAPAGRLAPDVFATVLLTNALAPLRLIETLEPCMTLSGAVVAMSSVLGSVAGNGSGGYDVYRASKAALNTLLRCHAARHPRRTVIAMHPGWVRTAMGGKGATLGVEESARGMADVIAVRSEQPGCVFVDWRNREIAW